MTRSGPGSNAGSPFLSMRFAARARSGMLNHSNQAFAVFLKEITAFPPRWSVAAAGRSATPPRSAPGFRRSDYLQTRARHDVASQTSAEIHRLSDRKSVQTHQGRWSQMEFRFERECVPPAS